MTNANKSEKLYSSSAEEFIKSAFKEDYYLGFGVGKAGYEKYTNKLSKVAANNAIFGKRVLPNSITAVIERKDWESKSYIPYNPAVDITNSICFNSTDAGLYLCLKDGSNNKQSSFDSEKSRYKPSGSAGVVLEYPDGYQWILIAKDQLNNYLTDYVRIRGIDTMIQFKGPTADSASPTGSTGGGGATGLSTGTCCLYAKRAIDINGVCLDKGDIVQAFTVPNKITCEIFGTLLDLHPIFKGSLLGVCGGFFNYSGTAGCTPCNETESSVTVFEVYGDIVSQYSVSDPFRINYETQSTGFKSGGLVNVVWWDDPTKAFYVSKEDPELVLDYDGTIGNFKAYLKTEYVGSNLGYKVIGVKWINALDVEDCVYIEPIALEAGVIGTSPNGDFSECLTQIEFGFTPEADGDYLNVYGLLRPSKIAIERSLTKTELQQLTPTTINPTFQLDSIFISKGIKYPDGRKITPLVNRAYTPPLNKTAATATVLGTLTITEQSFISDPVSASANYFSNKLNRTKTSKYSADSVEPANPLSAYKMTNLGGDEVLLTSYTAATSLTGGITLNYSNTDKSSGSVTISSLTKAPYTFDGCEIIFASDTDINSSSSTYTVTAIFDIS
jgi:hypothetical protein